MPLRTPPALMYHRVGLPAYENDNMPPEEFDKQMQYLADQGYSAISPHQYFSFLNREIELPTRSFLISFDDGAKNIMEHALPIMKKYNFKAVIFLNTAYIGRVLYHSRTKRKFYQKLEDALLDGCSREELWDFNYLGWPEIRALAGEGMSFGSHGHSHLVLTKLPRKKLREELQMPRDIMAKEIGDILECFSYPWGTFNHRVKRYVKACGYRFAFAGNHSHREDFYSLKRILIRTKADLNDFICLLNKKEVENKRMKIAMYNVTTKIQYGGIETFVWELSKYLTIKGHEIHIITGKGKVSYGSPAKIIEHIFIPRKYIFKLGIRFLRKFSERLSFAVTSLPYLIKENYDIIHIHKPFDLPLAYLLKHLKGTKIVMSSHGSDFFPGDKYFAVAVDRFTSVSKNNSQGLKERFNAQVKVIYNGVDLAIFRPLPQGKELRNTLGLSGQDRIVMAGGRIIESKGFQYLIYAVEKLKKEWPVKLVIMGEGRFKRPLEYLRKKLRLEKEVIFTGYVKNSDLPRYYSFADVFVIPSVGPDDAFPITLIEAMACGKAVVGSIIGGIPEAIQDGINGFLVPVKDGNVIAEKLALLFSDTNLCRKMGEESYKRTREYFDWDKIADAYISVYKEILGG